LEKELSSSGWSLDSTEEDEVEAAAGNNRS
jgi:hypothetical protein